VSAIHRRRIPAGPRRYRYQREIDAGDRKIVGVNAYTDKQPYVIPLLAMDPQGFERQAGRLEALRKRRDPGAVGQALDRLRVAGQGTENTMPFILDAVPFATLGIAGVMKDAAWRKWTDLICALASHRRTAL
jgi:methylmalonyl-CoA mutase N-terminal domain/subunit